MVILLDDIATPKIFLPSSTVVYPCVHRTLYNICCANRIALSLVCTQIHTQTHTHTHTPIIQTHTHMPRSIFAGSVSTYTRKQRAFSLSLSLSPLQVCLQLDLAPGRESPPPSPPPSHLPPPPLFCRAGHFASPHIIQPMTDKYPCPSIFQFRPDSTVYS